MDKPVAAAPTGAKEKVEKQARQLAYDVRYKTKQALAQKSGGKMDPAQVQKAYMSQLAKSPAPPAVKSRAKQMLMGEDYKSDLGKLVSDNAATALYKVFVEHHQKDENGNVIEHDDTTPSSVEEITEEEKTYKVRVTDKKTGNSYVRMATRSKISELRSNPNISSVEMTEYGTPTKSEKYKGKQTAAAKAGKDYDGDGKIESPTAEYKGSKDKAIKKAIATRKEEYSWRDGFAELIEKNDKEKKITGEGVNNKKLIKVFPDEVKEMYGSAAGTGATNAKPAPKPDPQMASKEKKQALLKKQVLLKKLQAVRAGAGSDITSSYEPEKKLTEGEDGPCDPKPETPAGMGDITFDAGGAIPTTIKAIGDPREVDTAIRLKKTQLRASGLNMSHELEGELVETKSKIDSSRKSYLSGGRRNKARFGKEGSMTKRGYYGQYPSEYSEMGDKRREEHRKKRGVKTKGTVAADIKKSIKETAANEAYTVTNSDKNANTKAYQDMKAGKKNAVTGEPLYKKADHMNENLVTISNINVKPNHYTSEKDVIKEILEKGTKGKIGFRSGGQFKKDPKSGKEKYVQSMKTDKVTVMHKGTKASGGTKARKRPQSPEGKAIGALSKHRSQQWKAERKMKDARKRGDKKEADKQWKKAQSSYDKRRSQSGKLFDKTGDFHDRADND